MLIPLKQLVCIILKIKKIPFDRYEWENFFLIKS
jgi:hypothetical protein